MPSMTGIADITGGWLAEAVAQLQTEAASRPAVVQDHRQMAGHEVCVRYAASELADLLGRSASHLNHTPSDAPALTIDCWIAPDPELPLPPSDPAAGTTYADDGTAALTWDGPGGPLFAYDRARRHGWARFAAPAGPPPWELAAPFSRIVHWWAADHGLQIAHAAAVGRAAGGILLVGRSGSGKSTTALACLEAGLLFAGDDICLLEAGHPPRVHGLYLSAKGDANTASLLHGYRENFEQSLLTLRNKTILFADDLRPESVVSGFPLLGVVVLQLSPHTDSSLEPLNPAAALRAVAPSTVMHTPGNYAAGLKRLANIVRGLPAWKLTLGSDPAVAAALIKELLDGQAGP